MASDVTVVFKNVEDVKTKEEAKDWLSGKLCVVDIYVDDYTIINVEDDNA